VRGETPGGEQFLTLFKHYYPAFAKQLTFNLGTFDEVQGSLSENLPLSIERVDCENIKKTSAGVLLCGPS